MKTLPGKDGFLFSLAFFLLGVPAALLPITQIGFAAGIPMTRFHLPLAMLATMFALLCQGQSDLNGRRSATAAIALGTILFVASSWLSAVFTDFSYDGQSLHIPAVLALASGWNPLSMATLVDWDPAFASELVDTSIFIEHYAMGSWIAGAAIFSLTGAIETGKAFNLTDPLVAAIVAWLVLGRLYRLRWPLRLTLAAILGLNPITTTQWTSFYVDGQVAALTTIVILTLLDELIDGRSRLLQLLGLAGIGLANLKFTGVAFLVTLSAIAIVWTRLIAPTRKSPLPRLALIAVLAIPLAGLHPYLSNAVRHGNPFHPLGDLIKNPLEGQQNAEFLARNRFVKLFYAVAGRQDLATGRVPDMPQLKWPWSVTAPEIWQYGWVDLGMGAFGPLFYGVLTILIFTGGLALARRPALDRRLTAGLVLILGSMAVLSEMWKGRYAPQLWLVPGAIIATLSTHRAQPVRLAALGATLLLVLNIAIVLYVNISFNLSRRAQYAAEINRIEADAPTRSVVMSGSQPVWRVAPRQRLAELGLAVGVTDLAPCANPVRFGFPLLKAPEICPATE